MQIKGIDVSHYQGEVDWAKVKAADVEFVFIKATEGTNYKYVDYFRNQAPRALESGVDVGAYHYGKFSTIPEAITEAKYFLSVVKDFKLTYPLVLDLEENKEGVSKKQLTDSAIAFLEVLEHAGYFAMIYSGKDFFENRLESDRFKPYAQWIARYGVELGRNADVWQYASDGKVEGVSGNVDLNWSYRDFANEIARMHQSKPVKTYHTVVKGDTVSGIAADHHTSVKAVDKLNPQIKDINKIFPGQKIRVK